MGTAVSIANSRSDFADAAGAADVHPAAATTIALIPTTLFFIKSFFAVFAAAVL
jgi:hypothetical protein